MRIFLLICLFSLAAASSHKATEETETHEGDVKTDVIEEGAPEDNTELDRQGRHITVQLGYPGFYRYPSYYNYHSYPYYYNNYRHYHRRFWKRSAEEQDEQQELKETSEVDPESTEVDGPEAEREKRHYFYKTFYTYPTVYYDNHYYRQPYYYNYHTPKYVFKRSVDQRKKRSVDDAPVDHEETKVDLEEEVPVEQTEEKRQKRFFFLKKDKLNKKQFYYPTVTTYPTTYYSNRHYYPYRHFYTYPSYTYSSGTHHLLKRSTDQLEKETGETEAEEETPEEVTADDEVDPQREKRHLVFTFGGYPSYYRYHGYHGYYRDYDYHHYPSTYYTSYF